ncbi:hypothetical protein [Sabulicella glaciei]|uniref:DUF4164 family protein n=1 Tax=Sabulicella glaciei TaxID=2984948 RepID=A0ABT3NPX4_9PROT|nr:hypothetical protein [Roseococcus sp. MDT2-1-1]MCW8084209.1 hypothetical protein [Roseococcus sp. MDT2-1-1]
MPGPRPKSEARDGHAARLAALADRLRRAQATEIRLDEKLRQLQAEQEENRRRAREEFGTDDPDALRRIAEERRAEADVMLRELEAALDEAEEAIAQATPDGAAPR